MDGRHPYIVCRRCFSVVGNPSLYDAVLYTHPPFMKFFTMINLAVDRSS